MTDVIPWELSAPLVVNLYLTSQCNLNCSYCYARLPGVVSQEPTLSEIKSIISQAADMGVFQMLLGGGEPFLSGFLLEAAEHAAGLGMQTCILSNGTLIKESDIPFLRRFTEKDRGSLQISLDSPSIDINNKTRGESQKVISTIRTLIDAGIKLNIGTVVTKHNVASAENIVSEFYPGVKFFHFMPLMPSHTLGDEYNSLVPSASEMTNFVQRLRSLRSSMPSDLSISNLQREDDGNIPISCQFPGCAAAKTRIDIDGGLIARACSIWWDSIIGDLREISLAEAWQSAAAKKCRKMEIPPCGRLLEATYNQALPSVECC